MKTLPGRIKPERAAADYQLGLTSRGRSATRVQGKSTTVTILSKNKKKNQKPEAQFQDSISGENAVKSWTCI